MEELIFKYVPVEISLQGLPGFFGRDGDTVVILVRDGRGRWVLGRKDHFYPDNIFRMIGGASDGEENPLSTALRELTEETGSSLDEEKLVPLIHAEISGQVNGKESVKKSVFVFYTQMIEPMTAQDDLSGFAYLSDHEFADLVQRYSQLSEEKLINNDGSGATWHDYGLIWGPIHAEAMERVKELGL